MPTRIAADRDGATRPDHINRLLDEALEGTFPASDPVAISFEGGTPDARSVSSTEPARPGSPATERGTGRREEMEKRLDYMKVAPDGVATFRRLQAYVEGCGLEHPLLELVKTRASQINGCAFCLDMHTKDARAGGETEQRLYALPAWRETPFFSARERAALAWTEAVTQVHEHGTDDALYTELREHFSDKEIVDLTLAIIAINGWNRLAIPFRTPAGTYRVPGAHGRPEEA